MYMYIHIYIYIYIYIDAYLYTSYILAIYSYFMGSAGRPLDAEPDEVPDLVARYG